MCRIVLPATIHGEIVKNDQIIQKEHFKKMISQKRKQMQYLAVFYNLLALVLQFVWIGLLVWIAPFVSGIYRRV